MTGSLSTIRNKLFLLSATLISLGSFAQSVAEDLKTDSFIEQKRTQSEIVGLAGAILVDKKVVWARGYGYADRENKISFTTTTLINIASISKTITAACLMHAVESGKLNLDEDINNYLPFSVVNPHFPNDKITLRQLSTHTSGVADREPYEKSYHFGGDSPDSLGDFIKQYFIPGGAFYDKKNFLRSRPGSYYEYSNMGAALAGYVIETVTGERLNTYSRHILFEPLEMNDTGWFFSEINRDHHSKHYYVHGDSVSPIEFYGLTTYPDGGVRTSVEDLSKFLIAMLSDGGPAKVLERKSIEEMRRPQFTDLKKPSNIKPNKENSGIFWSVENNGTKTGHDGGDPGVNTIMYYDTSKQVGVILFVNTSFEKESKGDKVIASISDQLLKKGLSMKKNATAK